MFKFGVDCFVVKLEELEVLMVIIKDIVVKVVV